MAANLSAPRLFQLTPGSGSITLNFDIVSFTAFTDVLYATNGGEFLSLGAIAGPVTITKESDGSTDLVNDTSYSIQLVGVSTEYPLTDETLRSTSSICTPRAADKGPTPPVIDSINPGDGNIEVEYTLGDNGGSDVTGIYFSTDDGTTWTELSGTLDGTGIITTESDGVTPIENDTEYTIIFASVNAVEPAPEDNVPAEQILAIPSATAIPATTPYITGHSPGDGQLSVSYTLTSTGGSEFQMVYYSTDDGDTWAESGTTSGLAQILNQSNGSGLLVNGDTYKVRLLVTTADFPLPDPNVNSPTPRRDMIPGSEIVAPDAPQIGPWTAGDQMLTVSYELKSDGGSPILKVYYSTDGGETWEDTGSTNGNAIIYYLSSDGSTPLTNEEVYPVTLVAITAVFDDETANPASAPSIPMKPSTGIVRPSVVSIDTVEPGDAFIALTYSLESTGGSLLANIYYSTDAGNSWAPTNTINGLANINAQSSGFLLENDTTYYLMLVAATTAFEDYLNNPYPNAAVQVKPQASGTDPVKPGKPEIDQIITGDATFTVIYKMPVEDGGTPIIDIVYSTDGGDSWFTTGESFPFGQAIINAESSNGMTPLTNGEPGYYLQLMALTEAFSLTNNPVSNTWPIQTSDTPTNPSAPEIIISYAGDATIQIDYRVTLPGGSDLIDVLYTTNGGSGWVSTGNISGTAIITADSNGNPLVNDTDPYIISLVAITAAFDDPNANPWSAEVTLIPTVQTSVPPDAPTIETYNPGNGQLEVFFSLANPGSGVLQSIWYSTFGGAWIQTNSTAESFIMNSDSNGNPLLNDNEYNVRIVAVTSDYQDTALNTPSESLGMVPRATAVAPAAPEIQGYSPGDTTLVVRYKLGSSGGSYFEHIWYSTTNAGDDWCILTTGNIGMNENLLSQQPIAGSTFGTISHLSTDCTTPLTNGVTYPVRLMVTTGAFPDTTNPASDSFPMTPSDVALRPSAPAITSWEGTDGGLIVRYKIPSDGGSSVTAVYYSTDGGLSWDNTRTTTGTAVIMMTSGGSGPIVNSTTYGVRLVVITIAFPSLSNPFSSTVYMTARPTLPGTFKPKGMSYTEFLRSKKADMAKILNTKTLRTASEITNSRRLAASTVFALNNEGVKGSITTPIDFSQGGLHAARSYYKQGGAGRRVGSASEFTAFSGSQAIGGLAQAGLPPARILQRSNFILVSAPVSQSAGDYMRREQGCKTSLGQQHNLTEVTPPKFVDNTIRNTGSPACVTRPAIHDIKAKNAFAYVPNRPSQAEGQYALKGDSEPGKELGGVGGKLPVHLKINKPITTLCSRTGANPNYKAGAAIDDIPYVEKHRGNDLGVNPKRPFVRYQIPAGATPVHLKINKPVNTI